MRRGPTPRSSRWPAVTRCGNRLPTWTAYPPHLTFEIAHFFDVYKDLEPDKLTKVGGFDGVGAAWEEIERSFQRARHAP